MPVIVSREVTTATQVGKVFAYLSDFETTTQWDPGTVRTTRVDGDGGVGTVYRNASTFAGRTTDLTYVVTRVRAPELIQLRGENATVIAVDTMTLAETPDGTRVTYRAEFTFKGAWRFVAPLLAPRSVGSGTRRRPGCAPRSRSSDGGGHDVHDQARCGAHRDPGGDPACLGAPLRRRRTGAHRRWLPAVRRADAGQDPGDARPRGDRLVTAPSRGRGVPRGRRRTGARSARRRRPG